MGLFNTVLKSVAKKVALATLVVVGKQVLTKAIGSAIEKRKADDGGAHEEVQAPATSTTPATPDTAVKAKPVRKSRAKPKPAAVTDEKTVKKPAASRSKPKDASAATATARKPRAPRKPKVVESQAEAADSPSVPTAGSASE
ncbi:molecular chaperone DnaK [Methylovorus mays]|uniref:molecular chaperone DnaK n=1 Tax=Methylovorus mays TaxID=184077 RepID=UPI001E5F9FA8|nr:molecular chaperone DnaK [Methylovorus mays]MCB5207605.1 molecular chaperone DnaK [Methylovorus mays]